MFPAYDEQPGPSIDDYTCPLLKDHRSGLVRLWRITLQRPIFTKSRRSWQRRRKNTHAGSPGFLCPKSLIFNQFLAKWLLDNTIFIRYLNFGCLKPLGTSYCIVAIQYVVTHLQWPHYSVDLFSKSEFLSFGSGAAGGSSPTPG